MPPLSAYTPLESLLFFQSLAGLDAPPASFAAISNLLRSNPFVRHNVAFDAQRLSPEALQDLYATLMRDGDPLAVIPHEPNGHPDDGTAATTTNPKKRKIASPRSRSHSTVVPGLVSRLYARYKELVTREIKDEEQRYRDINDEIDRLQRDRDALREPLPASVTPVAPSSSHGPPPEPMEVDVKEGKPPAEGPKPDVAHTQPSPPVEAQKPSGERPRKEPETSTPPVHAVPPQGVSRAPQQPAQPVPPPAQAAPTETLQKPPAQPQLQPPSRAPPPATQPPHPQARPPPPSPSQPLPPQPPPAAVPPPQSDPSRKKPSQATPRPVPAPQGAPEQAPPAVPRPPPSVSQPPTAATPPVAVGPRPPTGTPTHAPAHVPGSVAPPTPAAAIPPQPPMKHGPSVSTPPVPPSPAQSSFQQWSLNPPQTPQPPPSQPRPKPSAKAAAGKPVPPPAPFAPASKPTPQPSPKREPAAQPSPAFLPPSVPTTPRPAGMAVPLPAAGARGVETPLGVATARWSESRGSRPTAPSVDTAGSSTPWKKTPLRLNIPESPRSPDRPRPEDVSPISDRAPSPPGSRDATPEEPVAPPVRRKRRGPGRPSRADSPRTTETESKVGATARGEKTGRSARRRERSPASSRSRGRSVLSPDATADSAKKIKRELPSTPAGVPETAEPEPRASVGGRKGAVPASEERPARGRPKRKRAPSEAAGEAESLPPPSVPPQAAPEASPLGRPDASQSSPYVLCPRNFPRTGAPIMNDVTMHKHASIFTKPLTERDAPGYRDLIYRPQDLKSIKSCIHQGTRAVTAAAEAANTPMADGESPAPSGGTPSKNAVLLLPRSEEVIPPRGIVNSAQLEKELIRMFANAVMFNPVPQRGFGPAFPLTADGASRESTLVPEPDEGGIIKDTLEMFEDVEQAVTRWRAAERTADELASKSVLALRRSSASDLNTDSADEVKGEK